MLTPDKSKKIHSETDVTTPAGLECNDAYDLALYHDTAGGKKGVLVVSMDIQVIFKDGKSGTGAKLTWDHGSKTDFLTNYKAAVKSVWSEKWRITTSSSSTAVNDIGVIFEPNLIAVDWYWGDHWEISVTKTDSFLQSWVNPLWGSSQHDSEDLKDKWNGTAGNKPGCSGAANVCAIQQRGAVHEFGHMLGLRDEYPAAKANGNWLADNDSIMHSGESVRPRHYTIFSDWITEQYSTAARLLKEKIEFKVDGSWSLANAQL